MPAKVKGRLLALQALSKNVLSLSKHLVNRIEFIWASRQKAAYYSVFFTTPEADPFTHRALQRRRFKPLPLAASSPADFYAVRLNHFPGIYASWLVGRSTLDRRHSHQYQAFQHAEKSRGLHGQVHGTRGPPVRGSLCESITDGSTLPSGCRLWSPHHFP